MSGAHQRVSPRKFSEKIALLNKSEQEANAKFEEIIKEVQGATKLGHTQQCFAPCQLSMLGPQEMANENAELLLKRRQQQQQGASVDSQEEIERVYENLVKSIDQEYEEEQREMSRSNETQQNHHEAHHYQAQQQQTQQQQQQYYDSNGRPTFRSSSAGPLRRTLDGAAQNEPKPVQPTNYAAAGFLGQQQFDANGKYLAPTRTDDLNNNNDGHNYQQQFHQQQIGQPQQQQHFYAAPTQSSYASQSQFQNQNQNIQAYFGVRNCNSNVASCYGGATSTTTTITTNNNNNNVHAYPAPSRPRVVSFGSASTSVHRAQLSISEAQRSLAEPCQINSAHDCHQANYLREPAGERSRQKSCSDPALHVSPNQRAEEPMVTNCNSELKIAAPFSNLIPNSNQVAQNCPLMCCSNSIPTMLGPSITNREQQQQQKHKNVPGIKICAIDDVTSAGLLNEPKRQNSSAPNEASSRDSSLPDIANLQFASKPLNQTTPDGNKTTISDCNLEHWPQNEEDNSRSLDHLEIERFKRFADSCQAIDGSWSSSFNGACPRTNDAELDLLLEVTTTGGEPMEGQQDHPMTAVSQAVFLQQKTASFWPQQQQQQQQQLAPNQLNHSYRVANISNSECGITLVGQENFADNSICMSNDSNSFMRSKSHSNISYLARHSKLGAAAQARQMDDNEFARGLANQAQGEARRPCVVPLHPFDIQD